MGINMLKQRATKWLESSKENATTDALAAANARIDELMAMVEAGVPHETPKKRGRPKKEAIEE